jgi:hypothetical protein
MAYPGRAASTATFWQIILQEALIYQFNGLTRAVVYSTPFGHLFHADSATQSTVIRPPNPQPFGRAVGAKRRGFLGC